MCHSETRVQLLQDIEDWSWASQGRPIFWLKGLAGTGKSTVAKTIASRFDAKQRLGASFFFARGQGDRGHAKMFFTTLAFQLSTLSETLSYTISEAIGTNQDIVNKRFHEQWRHLICGPLEKCPLHHPILVVIDALDECDSENDVGELLRVISRVKDIHACSLRFFITSRPETSIRLGFHNMPEIVHHDLMLHSIPRSVIEHDITLFLRYELGKVRKDRFIEEDWPGEENIQKLIHKADRLFIYAATVCRFIGGCLYPEKRLSEMLQVSSASPSSTKELDRMYMQILEYSIATGCDEDRKDMARLFKADCWIYRHSL